MLVLGSDGFRNIAVRSEISDVIRDKSGKMLIIPLASMFGKETGEKEKDFAVMTGFQKDNIHVFDDDNPDEFLNTKFDYIVVSGGNTFQLLYYVKKYCLDTFIRKQVNNDTIYMGFSAGACLACRDIEYVKNFDDNNHITDGDFSALGLTDKYFLCHFDYRGIQEIKMCRNYINDESEIITIGENQLVIL